MNPWKRMTSPFYSTGAVALGSVAKVDAALAEGAKARFDGDTTIVRWPDGHEHYHRWGIGAKRRAAAWCNKFNERTSS